MKYTHLTQRPYDTHPIPTQPLVTGIDLNYRRYLNLEVARYAWLTSAASLEPLTIITCGDLADSLESLARIAACDCMAFKDEAGRELTTNAARYWRTFTWRKLVPEANGLESAYSIGGPIGSLASLVYVYPDRDWATTPLPLLRSLISTLWTELLQDVQSPPAVRMQSLLVTLGYDLSYLKEAELALIKYAKTGVPQLRLNALDELAFTDLGLRLLLGELADPALAVWTQLQIETNSDPQVRNAFNLPIASYQKPTHHLQMGLTIGYGGGGCLLFQAIYIEALIAASDLLRGYSSLNLNSYANDPSTALDRRLLATYYTTCADALSFLAMFGTIANAEPLAQNSNAQALRWLATLPSSLRQIDPQWRLQQVARSLTAQER